MLTQIVKSFEGFSLLEGLMAPLGLYGLFSASSLWDIVYTELERLYCSDRVSRPRDRFGIARAPV